MRGFLSFLIDALVPATCVCCGRWIAAADGTRSPLRGDIAAGPAFDPGCVFDLGAGFLLPSRVLCSDCWEALERSPAHGALAGRANIPIIAPFYTSTELLALVRFLKFSGGRSAAPPLAWWMARSLHDALGRLACAGAGEVLLVPVPLHRRRLRERGYDQALLLAREVGRALGLTVANDALVRSRHTRSQSKLAGEERVRNVRGAFGLARPDTLRSRTVILVDDLVTTGQTARACLEALDGAACSAAAVLAAGRVRDSCLTEAQ